MYHHKVRVVNKGKIVELIVQFEVGKHYEIPFKAIDAVLNGAGRKVKQMIVKLLREVEDERRDPTWMA